MTHANIDIFQWLITGGLTAWMFWNLFVQRGQRAITEERQRKEADEKRKWEAVAGMADRLLAAEKAHLLCKSTCDSTKTAVTEKLETLCSGLDKLKTQFETILHTVISDRAKQEANDRSREERVGDIYTKQNALAHELHRLEIEMEKLKK